jgi:hypothetical protein
MREVKYASAALGLIIGVLAVAPANAWDRRSVDILFEVPDLMGQGSGGVKSSVEGITVGLASDGDNKIYAASSGVNSGLTSRVTGPANLFIFDPNAHHGTPPTQLVIKPPPGMGTQVGPTVNGIRFNPKSKALWVLNMFDGNPNAMPPTLPGAQILSVNTTSGDSTYIAAPALFSANATLNALTFDNNGNGYVTDSNGAIYKIPQAGGSVTTWSSDPLLSPAPGLTPTFGANGIEFDQPGGCVIGGNTPCNLYVANAANRQILRFFRLKADGTGDTPVVEVNGVNGPDGIAVNGTHLWVCAGQEDEIVVLNLNSQVAPAGKVLAKLGDFQGLTNGTVKGLLFPASLAFSNESPPKTLYVSNLASQGADSIDSAWARQVTKYTVSKINVPTIPDTGLFK